MRSHPPTGASYLLTIVTVFFSWNSVGAQSLASIEGQVTDQKSAVIPGS